jgi:hypothetical protein
MDGVAELAFVGVGAGEDMVTNGVKVFAAGAFGVNEGGGEGGEA